MLVVRDLVIRSFRFLWISWTEMTGNKLLLEVFLLFLYSNSKYMNTFFRPFFFAAAAPNLEDAAS